MTPAVFRRWFDVARAALPAGRLRKAATAVGDQGLVSAGTFLLNISLARLTAPADYGVFVLCFSGIVFSMDLQNALVTEPMMVYGSTRPEQDRSRYLGSALALQLLFTSCCVIAVGLASAVWWGLAGPSTALFTLAATALGLLGIHAREFVRKTFFTVFLPGRALATDTLYLLLLLSGLAIVIWRGELSGVTAFAILGLAGALSAAVGLMRADVALKVSPKEIGEAARLHWGYGKWMIGVSGSRWSGNELYYFVAATFVGPAGTGALKAVQNIFAPIALVLAGLGNLLLPVTSRLVDRDSARTVNRFVIALGAVLGSGVLAYGLLVWIGADAVFQLLYGGQYATYAYLLPIVGIGHLLVGAFQGPSLALRALGQTKRVFTITTVGAAITVVAVVPLTAAFGLVGAVVSMLLSLVVGAPLWVVMYRRSMRERRTGPPVKHV